MMPDTQPFQPRAVLLCALLLLFVVSGCATAPPPRLEAYRQIAAWLEAHALPDEIVGLQQHGRAWARLSSHTQVALPTGSKALALLDALKETRPDYCVATRSVAWEGVQATPWFQEHYSQVAAVSVTDDPASPLLLYRYHLAPFDAGETAALDVVLEDDQVGQLALQSIRLSRSRLVPGQPVYATLEMSGDVREPLQATWQLREVSSGRVWMEETRSSLGGAPTDAWPPNRIVLEQLAVTPPDNLAQGDYVLELDFTRPNRAPFGDPVLLATLSCPPDVTRVPPEPERTAEILAGETMVLLGYDAPAQVAPGATLHADLVWHAVGHTDRSYKAFVHVLNTEGQLVAQSDTIPANWTYPTTAWQPGEYIRDSHAIVLAPTLPRGDYQIAVGLYDSETGDRLPLRYAGGTQLPDGVAPLYVLEVR